MTKLVLLATVAAAALLASWGAACDAVVYSRCGLADELSARGFLDLPDWVCLVEAESGRDTSAVSPTNGDGSQDFGLFQINNYYFCGMGAPGGDCNLDCYALTDDSIHRGRLRLRQAHLPETRLPRLVRLEARVRGTGGPARPLRLLNLNFL